MYKYFYMKFRNELYIFFVEANYKNEDIVFLYNEPPNILLEEGARCPPYCPEESVLIK